MNPPNRTPDAAPLFEALEPRLLLAADLYIDGASVSGFSGIPGTACTLTIEDVGNLGDSYVFGYEADVEWYLSPDADPYGIYYTLWSGTTPWGIPGFSGGGQMLVQGIIPKAPTGQYYVVAFINSDGSPAEFDYSNNYLVLSPPLNVLANDDHGDYAWDATSVSIGANVAGNIESPVDRDYFEVYLEAGQPYTIETTPGSLTDTFLTLYDTDGTTVLASDDDSGQYYGSKIEATPTQTGYYYVCVEPTWGGYDRDMTGSYGFRVRERALPGPLSAGGRIVYRAPDRTYHPLRFVEIHLFDEESAGDDELIGWTYTDENGAFFIDRDEAGWPITNVDFLPDVGTRDLYVSVLAANPAATVSRDWWDTYLGYVWAPQSATAYDVADGLFDFGDLNLADEWRDMGLILDNIAFARDWLYERTGWDRDQMTVHWPAGSWPCYQPSYSWQDLFDSDTIKLPLNLTRNFPDAHSVVVHEYGHAIHHEARGGNLNLPNMDPPSGKQASRGGGHWHYSQSSPGFALVEGWAAFFQCVVFDDPTLYGLALESNDYWMGVDGRDGTNDDANTGEIVEGAVASIFWDIYDPANDDGIDGEFDNLWTIFLNDDPNSIWNREGDGDFYHYWDSRYGQSDALDAIFLDHGIPVRDEWLAANLTADLGCITFPHTIVPGDKGKVPVIIANNGLLWASGSVTANVYVSTDPDLSGDDVLLGSSTMPVSLAPGGSVVADISLAFDEDMPVGTYFFVAEIVPDGAIVERDAADNVVASDDPREWAWKFGTFDDRKSVKLTVRDENNVPTVFSLKGQGYGEILGRSDFDSVTLNDTDQKSALTITQTGMAEGAPIGGLTVNGSMRSIDGRAVSLRGNLTVTGVLGNLTLREVQGPASININTSLSTVDAKCQLMMNLGRVANATIETNGVPIRSLSAIAWLDTDLTPDVIDAPSVGSLTINGQRGNARRGIVDVPGDFQADLLLSGEGDPRQTLTNARIAGSLTGAAWDVTGDVGTVSVSGEADGWTLDVHSDVRSLTLGDVTNTTVTVDGALGTLSALRWAGGGVTAKTLRSLNVAGRRGNARRGTEDVPGDFGVNLTLTGDPGAAGRRNQTLGSARISGNLAGAAWNITGDVGKLTVGGTADHSTVRSTGGMLAVSLGATDGSDFLAGIVPGALRHPDGYGDFADREAQIRSVTVKGWRLARGEAVPRFFADSNFSASQFGTISLLNADWDAGESGIYACDLGPGSEIRSVRYSDTDTGDRWSWPLRNQLFAGPPDLLHFLAAGP